MFSFRNKMAPRIDRPTVTKMAHKNQPLNILQNGFFYLKDNRLALPMIVDSLRGSIVDISYFKIKKKFEFFGTFFKFFLLQPSIIEKPVNFSIIFNNLFLIKLLS